MPAKKERNADKQSIQRLASQLVLRRWSQNDPHGSKELGGNSANGGAGAAQ